MTLSGCGSAEATPWGYASLRSRHPLTEPTEGELKARTAPKDAASSKNFRRLISLNLLALDRKSDGTFCCVLGF